MPQGQKPLYLLSGPNLLYGARATNLAVTILTESPVNVTTHLTQGNANLSSTTVTVPGVSGYQGEQLIFSNSTTLNVSLGDVSTSAQTDQARYRPGQTVRIRIASLHLDNRPYKGAVEISVSVGVPPRRVEGKKHNYSNMTGKSGLILHERIIDPGGNVIQRWDSQESHVGIISKDFLLSQSSALGEWTVVTTTNGLINKRVFMVENSDPPRFDLLLTTAPEVLVGQDISGTVRARPLSPPMLLNSVSVVVTQKTSSAGDQTETTALPVVGGGYVLIQLTLHAQVQELIIDATFMTSKETLRLFTKFPSASDSYVQILPFSSLPAQVSARGQVFTAGTVVASSSLSLTPMMSWFPEVCVTIYCVLPDGEVVSDTALVPIQQPNHVSLKWTKDWLKPGDQVSLLVTVKDPRSQVLILVTAGAKEAQLPLVDDLFNRETLRVSLEDLTISMDVPESLIRGEEIVLEMKVFNHLQWDREVIMLVEHSEAFEFVLSVDEGVSVVNARKATVGSQSSASVLFPIRPLALGEMEISSTLLSAETSESLVQTVLVKPEGVARTFSQTLFLELAPDNNKDSKTTSFSFPPDVVPGSQRVHVAVVGDILALSIGSLESLVDLPQSCGEQNMVPFVPSIAVLQYLDPLDNAEIRARALAILAEGYRKELSYQRDDGSFSAFGNRDSSGSTWLTAFVLRSFLQAQPYMLVDQSVVSRAADWLVTNQGPGGDFAEAGRVIHTEMSRCRDDCPATLTAFVVMALLEDKTYAVKYESTVSQAVAYLERTVLATTGNYTLCVMMYALTLANRPAANDVLEELRRRTDVTDGFRWRSADVLQAEGEWQARSAEVEMVSYVLMALFRRGAVTEGFPLMKWLSKQRSSLGGYGSTQDTSVAVQAIALYASISGAFAIDLNIQMSVSSMSGVFDFNINSANYLLYQSKEVVPTLPRPPVEAFSLIVEVQDDKGDPDHMLLSICTGLLGIDGVSQTGMVIVDVGLLSGFIIVPEAAAPVDPIRQVETPPGRVILYLDSLTLAEVCIRLPLVRRHKVALIQNATVHVYDYYEPGRGAKRMYNSELMQVMDSCSFCGQDCSHCQSGVSLVKSSSTSWHAVSIATCSLGTLFAVMTLSFA
ncbi:unnamed protein product [Merluccius merluccius]